MSSHLTKSPLISIIIPTHNRSGTLARAISSVIDQSFSDWEVIIIDDGSTDKTEEVVKVFQNTDKRITYIKLADNSGAGFARNIGIKRAKGDYLAFLDSDDHWLPQKLEKQLAVFTGGNECLGLVYTGAYFVDDISKESRFKKAVCIGSIFNEEIAYNPIGGSSRVVIKASCLKKCGLFDEDLPCHEDWDLWIRISREYDVGSVNEALVYYHESADSLSINADKLIRGYEILWAKHNIANLGPSIISLHYLRLGHRLCYYNYINLGRVYLLKALKIEPWRLKNIFLSLLSFLSHRVYRRVTFLTMKVSF